MQQTQHIPMLALFFSGFPSRVSQGRLQGWKEVELWVLLNHVGGLVIFTGLPAPSHAQKQGQEEKRLALVKTRKGRAGELTSKEHLLCPVLG